MPLLKRLTIIIALIEVTYLALFNIALNLPLTQDLINRIRPDMFTVSWESAWTLYPFRVHAIGVAANGQTRSQQWQLASPRASASISLLPLIVKTVSLNRVKARDVQYYQRPRPRPDRDYSTTRQYFPPIQGRKLEVNAPALPKRKMGKKSWTINIQNMFASGDHSIWLYQIQTSLKGEARADLKVITRGDPLSLSNGQLDLTLNSLRLNKNREVLREGYIKGSFELLPFVIKENKGIKSLAFLNLDAKISAQTKSLAFLNPYLQAFEGMKLDGTGELQGRVVFSQGRLLEPSELDITADALSLKLLDYQLVGNGDIHVDVPGVETDTPNPDAHFAIAFNTLDAFYANSKAPLLTGNGLVLNGVGTNNIIPFNGERPQARSMALYISSLRVPDLNAFQRYLPDKWAFKMHGGEGELKGQILIDQSSFSSSVNLTSDKADVGVNNLRFSSNLDMGLKVNSPTLETGMLDVSGTYIKLSETKISHDQEPTESWQAIINVEKGIIKLNLETTDPELSGAQKIVKTLKEQNISRLLAAADETLEINGHISDLRWLNVVLKNAYGLIINGSGKITADVVIKSGWLERGSTLAITPQELSVEFLDYVADGAGSIDIKVIRGGKSPDIKLDINIGNAEFRRKLEEQAFIENVDLLLQATAHHITLGGKRGGMELRLQIPSAKIRDMSIYNQYLPENSPLQFIAGTASLVVDILLKPENAIGYLELDTHKLRARIDEQQLSGELSAKIKLVGGVPKDMRFDISGSTLKLDAVKIIGDTTTFRDQDWAADIQFNKAHTVWKKPIQIDLKAGIKMTDSIPIVSMMVNQKGKETWLGKALTIDDVDGIVELQIANNQIVIPYAFASSDNIDVGAKAIINSESRNGVVYVRYKALKGLLKIKDGKRNLDVLRVKEKFDAYSTDEIIMEKRLSN